MTSDDAVDPAEAARTPTGGRRRGRWVPLTLVVALLVGIGAWQGAARIGRIVTGPATMAAGGLDLPECVPHDDYWTSFSSTEDVVVAHTVSNPSPWPVTIISTDPEVYRFEPLDEDPVQDHVFGEATDGIPDGTLSAVVVPPDRSVAMWIDNPQGDTIQGSTVRYSFDGAPLRVRSLGVEREVYVPYQGTLYVGGGSRDSAELSEALAEACEA